MAKITLSPEDIATVKNIRQAGTIHLNANDPTVGLAAGVLAALIHNGGELSVTDVHGILREESGSTIDDVIGFLVQGGYIRA